MESLSHMTAQHDYNWAKVAPQVAISVSSIMVERWGVGINLFWHQEKNVSQRIFGGNPRNLKLAAFLQVSTC